MEVISVASGVITILQAGSGIAIGTNHLRHEIVGLPARLRMNQHRINCLKAAIEIAKRQINSRISFPPTQLQFWAVDYIQQCVLCLDAASNVIDMALCHVGDKARFKRRISSLKLILGHSLSRTEQQLQDMTQMLGFLSLYTSQETQLRLFLSPNTQHDPLDIWNDINRISVLEHRDEFSFESPSPFCGSNFEAGPLLDEPNGDFFKIIMNEHQKKISHSPRWPLTIRALSKNWEIMLQKRKRGYLPFGLRLYSVRPDHDAIIRAVSLGDLEEMLELFRTKKASPFVRDTKGCSLLHYAACSFNLSMCRKLLDMGLGNCVDEATSHGLTPGHIILMNSVWNNWRYEWQSIQEIMAILEKSSDIVGYGQSPWVFLLGCSTAVITKAVFLTKFQRLAAPDYFQQPTSYLIQAARTYVLGGRPVLHPDPNTFLFLLGRKEVTTLTGLGCSTQSRVALIHTAAIGLIRYTRLMRPFMSLPMRSCEYREGRKLWKAICRAFVRLTHDKEIYCDDDIRFDDCMKTCFYNPPISWTGSPLMSVVHGLFLDEFLIPGAQVSHPQIGSRIYSRRLAPSRQRYFFDTLSSGIKNWLEIITNGGMDIASYGQKEKELFLSRKRENFGPLEYEAKFRCSRQNSPGYIYYTLPVCLFDFEYSSDINSWNFHWRVDAGRLVGEFWRMIESSCGFS